MATTWKRLQEAFIQDHRSLARGYRELIELLNQRDFVAASHAASRLDTVAGPHIEFEEKYLYPRAAQSRGDAQLSRLFHEHREILAVLNQILSAATGSSPDDSTVQDWITQLQQASDHAAAAATLIGELQSLPDSEQLRYLDGLTRLRDQGSRWSELECRYEGKT